MQQAAGGSATYVLNGGTLITPGVSFSGGTFLFQRGYLGLTGNYTVSDAGVLGGNVFIAPLQTLAISGQTSVPDFRAISLIGGTLSTDSLNVSANGTFNFN